jgi:hypothetical protein
MVHNRITDEDHSIAGGADSRWADIEQLVQHRADLVPNKRFEDVLTLVSQSKFDSAHYIRSVPGLGVKRGLHSEDAAGLQVEQLRYDRGRSEVDRYSKAWTRFEMEL